MSDRSLRPTWAEVDLDAITENTRRLAAHVAPAKVCSVVKAFAYGHGPVRVAQAAIRGGAVALAVALVEEGRQLREAGFDVPIFVLSEPMSNSMDEVVAFNLTPSLYTLNGVDNFAVAAARLGQKGFPVQVKVDTGMHRVGADPADATEVVKQISKHDELALGGVFTHFAVADEPDNPFTQMQIDRFDAWLSELKQEGVEPDLIHAANSAGAIAFPNARYDMVRIGIATYGIPPSRELEGRIELVPALSLKSRVSFVKTVKAHERISYGLRYEFERDSTVATVPIGYADGVPRLLAKNGGEVLIRGKRFSIAGTVTMDQITIDCGDEPVSPGDDVVLIGKQGDQEITAWDWATKIGDIAYATACGISARVPRRYVGDRI